MRFCRALLVSGLCVPLLGLGGCLDVYRPFAHNPGVQAQHLVRDNIPPVRLAVPVPVPEKAPWRAATAMWARDVVIALVGQSIPAVAKLPQPGDWWVRLGAVRAENGGIRPRYAIVGPDGKVRARGFGAVIDEEGWRNADPDALNTVALQMAPEIARELTEIQTRMMMDDPQSLMHRSARICFEGVKGAPGDGNKALGEAFYTMLPDGHNSVQTKAEGADYIVRTTVSVKPSPDAPPPGEGPQQQVTIVWHVMTPQGVEAGAATQVHDVPAHSLDGSWADVAGAAAQEAAEAVRTIITNYSGRSRKVPAPQTDVGGEASKEKDGVKKFVAAPEGG
ncbi:hypothetical protein NQF86_06985 [Bombella sp. TMW 2.2543]|uniref:Lipoprotein n=1 Tax=Bombella pluederhausensis TaxID=2967336 RepID=A0ABT3WIA8_9PROT|nr:hypothetical protein [Bombella pluederhausensis]MCX5618408.1 hypothetical protein [Bombella pluederhausensis]